MLNFVLNCIIDLNNEIRIAKFFFYSFNNLNEKD